jgi:hypothetical protein
MSLFSHIKTGAYTGLVFFYFVHLFWPHTSIHYILGFTGIICLALSFVGASRLFQTICTLFLLASGLIYLEAGYSLSALPHYFTSSTLLLALLYLLPFVNSVFKAGRYDRTLSRMIKLQATHMGQVYYRTSLVSYILSLFLFFAALPLVYDVIQKQVSHLKEKVQQKMVSETILRGFAMVAMWSPIEILVAMTVIITGVSYLSLLPWLLLLSVCIVTIDWLRGYWQYKGYSTGQASGYHFDRSVLYSLGILSFALILLIACASLVSDLLGFSFFTGMTVILLPYSFVWALAIRRFRMFLRYSLLVWKKKTPALQQLMLLFLSLGFFNAMINESDILGLVEGLFLFLAVYPFVLFLLIQVGTLILAMVGFHPLVTISLFGVCVQPLLGIINPLSLAIVLLLASLATSCAGPYNTTVQVTSGLLKLNPYRVSFMNMGFALLYGTMGSVLAWLLL